MSDEIKPGDLVMVVRLKPCCGNGNLGSTLHIGQIIMTRIICPHCHEKNKEALCGEDMSEGKGRFIQISRLKKINPPSEGDSLPTRADKEITA